MDHISMQSHLLKTFTANFDPEEDRIRLDCDLHIEEQAQIFVTQRLGILYGILMIFLPSAATWLPNILR